MIKLIKINVSLKFTKVKLYMNTFISTLVETHSEITVIHFQYISQLNVSIITRR